MYGYPAQQATTPSYGSYSTYAQNSVGYPQQTQQQTQLNAGNSSTNSGAPYSYPSAGAAAYAQYGQATSQPQQSTNVYGQQHMDYDYSSMFKNNSNSGTTQVAAVAAATGNTGGYSGTFSNSGYNSGGSYGHYSGGGGNGGGANGNSNAAARSSTLSNTMALTGSGASNSAIMGGNANSHQYTAAIGTKPSGALGVGAHYGGGYDASIYSASSGAYYQQQKSGSVSGGLGGGGAVQHHSSNANKWFNSNTSVNNNTSASSNYSNLARNTSNNRYVGNSGGGGSSIGVIGSNNHHSQFVRKRFVPTGGVNRIGGGGSNYGSINVHNHHHREVQQLYCDVCKISCGGNQAYMEHIQGKPHKRKEALLKGEGVQTLSRNKVTYRCEVCNISCSGRDAYDSHAKGAKHKKTVALLRRLNKPVLTEPTIIPPKSLVGGGDTEAKKNNDSSADGSVSKNGAGGNKAIEQAILAEESVKPIGEEYVEEKRDASGKLLEYSCKLCECKFSDPNAKDVHLKGRRHRLQYKTKVDPNLEVEEKPQPWSKPKYKQKPRPLRFVQPLCDSFALSSLANVVNANDDRHVFAKCETIQPNKAALQSIERLVSLTEVTLKSISDLMVEEEEEKVNAKKANRNINEDSMEEEKKTDNNGADEKSAADENSANDADKVDVERVLKGVMRVGNLSKKLVLSTDKQVCLVVLCSKVPTETLLKKIVELFPQKAKVQGDDKLEVTPDVAESGFVVGLSGVPLTCRVTLTCIGLRKTDDSGADKNGGDVSSTPPIESPADALPLKPCLDALAELRRAKWYQVKCSVLSSASVTLKLLRDISQRVQTWTVMSQWAIELLVEKALVSSEFPIASPSCALRRVFEVLSAGVYLKKESKLIDPCERDSVDVLASLTEQQREDVVASAQHALRLIDFNQFYKILNMERLADENPSEVAEKSSLSLASASQERKRTARESNCDDGDGKKNDNEAKKGKKEADKNGAEKSPEGNAEVKGDADDLVKLKNSNDTDNSKAAKSTASSGVVTLN